MTSFILKLIGVLTMLSDHIGDSIFGYFTIFNFIGRIAFPIFAFQSVQGYIHTKNLKKHILKLLIFACISQIPFMLFLSTFTKSFSLNVLFTFVLGLLAIFAYDKCKNKFLVFLIVILTSVIAHFIKVDYQAFGILLMFIFYIFKDKKFLMAISTTILCFAHYLPDIIKTPSLCLHYLLCWLFTIISIIFILFYNQKQGPKTKYFFYIFYPLHLLILYFIHMALY